jgi:hypothetical protein
VTFKQNSYIALSGEIFHAQRTSLGAYNMSTLTNKQKRNAFRYALGNPDNVPLFKAFFGFSAGAIFVQWMGGIPLWLTSIVLLVSMLICAVLIKTAFEDWAEASERTKRALLVQWARSAQAESVRKTRMDYLAIHNSDDALEFAQIDYTGPAVNVDGSAMVAGSDFDIHGHAYSILCDTAPVLNDATGSYAFPDDAYTPPHDM